MKLVVAMWKPAWLSQIRSLLHFYVLRPSMIFGVSFSCCFISDISKRRAGSLICEIHKNYYNNAVSTAQHGYFMP